MTTVREAMLDVLRRAGVDPTECKPDLRWDGDVIWVHQFVRDADGHQIIGDDNVLVSVPRMILLERELTA
jgi:hypothetical protein